MTNKRRHIIGYIVKCRTRKCRNAGAPIRLKRWLGEAVDCGVCGSPIRAQACWFLPPDDDGESEFRSPPVVAPTAESVAAAIASLTVEERETLADLIAPPTMEQVVKKK